MRTTMRLINNLKFFLLAVTAVPAFAAMPIVNLNKAEGCQQKPSQMGSLRDLVQQVNIIGRDEKGLPKDDRREIQEVAAKYGITDAEIYQAMACSGYSMCPTKNNGKGSLASSTSLRNNGQITTARHLFENEDGSPIDGLDKCFFKNYLGQKTFFEYQPNSFDQRVSTRVSQSNEPITIKLRDKLENCDSYEVDTSGEPMERGQEFLSVSFLQKGMPKKYVGLYPIVEKCKVMKTFEGSNGEASSYNTMCDSSRGGSGAINLIRKGKKWVAKSMTIGGGGDHLDGEEYSDDTDSRTVSVGFDSELIQLALRQTDPQRSPQQTASKVKEASLHSQKR